MSYIKIENKPDTIINPSKMVRNPPAGSKVFGQRVQVPTFELYSNPTIKIGKVNRRRFNVIDRATQKAKQEIMAQEDASIFDALNALLDK